jgi:hypothetical protein
MYPCIYVCSVPQLKVYHSWKSRSTVAVLQLEVSVLLSSIALGVILAIDEVSLWSFSWIYRLRAHNGLTRNVCHRNLTGVKGSPTTPQFHWAQKVWASVLFVHNLYQNDHSDTTSIAKITLKAIPLCKTLTDFQLRNDTSNWGADPNWGTLSTEARNTYVYLAFGPFSQTRMIGWPGR